VPESESELRQLYAAASDVELGDALREGKAAYTPLAWKVIQAEVARRWRRGIVDEALPEPDLRAQIRENSRKWHEWFIRAERSGHAVDRWRASLPPFWRPVLDGAGLALFPLLLRLASGGWLLLVGAVGAAVLRGDLFYSFSFGDLGVFAACIGLMILGGAVGGFAYSLIGRPLQRLPFMGPSLAGSVAVAPYTTMYVYMLHIPNGVPLLTPLGDGEMFGIAVSTAILGWILGVAMVRARIRASLPSAQQPTSL
jgi:hypothetical protein